MKALTGTKTMGAAFNSQEIHHLFAAFKNA
jgi:hypothetical protein